MFLQRDPSPFVCPHAEIEREGGEAVGEIKRRVGLQCSFKELYRSFFGV